MRATAAIALASLLAMMVEAMGVPMIGPMAPAVVGCTRVEPPAPDASPSVAAPELTPPSRGGNGPVGRASASAAALPAGTIPDSAAPASSGSAIDPASLPQTRDKPPPSGPTFEARVAALWDAVISDDPQLAMPFFFPLGAYRQVKDIPDPASDWKRRLVSAFAHDIHSLHERLGTDAPKARLVGLDLPDARARWVDPGEEYNKIGYYRVFGSRLRYEVDGSARAFDVKSLISWRGEWYVVHLSAIQ